MLEIFDAVAVLDHSKKGFLVLMFVLLLAQAERNEMSTTGLILSNLLGGTGEEKEEASQVP